MIRELILRGEVAVVGLGRSGLSVSMLLRNAGARVYASDAAAVEAGTLARLAAAGVDARGGGHDLDRVGAAAAVVVSPGVPPNAAPLVRARERNVPVVSEVEVALAFLPSVKYIAVTGTNGKSTVTALVAHLLRALGADAVAAGNIGTPLSEIALRVIPPDWVALELSSFQLHDTPGVAPAVGVLTNLEPDHLDRYASLEEYYGDKMLLFANATRESVWVTNGDDAEVERRTAGLPGARHSFSMTNRAADAGPAHAAEHWALLGADFIASAEIPLLGRHNISNTLAAALAVAVADPSYRTSTARARLVDGVRSFKALPHRLEVVAVAGGVEWIDDSKATNVSSARVAIEAMTRPTVVLLGGKHKHEPYTALLPALAAHASLVIAYGEAAPIIEADLAGRVPLVRLGSSFHDVIACARAAARPGGAVLLSPACSSYDMFANYEERGDTFRRLATVR
ncbi:MAG: UDP-N-acetylmuramoyl-L-alanine--D-glutamate ligase [Gemmatimonadales bacterium]